MFLVFAGKELIDAPPVIVAPKDLDKPENLVIIGKVSEQVNTLTCTASNAESVEWVYLEDKKLQTLNAVPSHVWTTLEPEIDENGDMTRKITDAGNTNNAKRGDQTGYYKCIARVKVNGNSYVTSTPPIRYISPGEVYSNNP